MKRLRLGAISAAIAAGLAVSYGVLAHDFSALKDGNGNSVRFAAGDCVETSGAAASGAACGKAMAATAAPAAMADKKEMMADKAAAPAAAAAAGGAAAAGATATAAKASGPSGLSNVKDGNGNTVNAGAGGCVESTAGNADGCAPAAKAMAAKPAAMADKKEMAAKAAAPAAAAAMASADANSMVHGGHAVGEASHGHLADGQKTPVRTGAGGCVNLGYSANSPDHPGDCAFQAGKAAVAAAPAAAKPAAPAARAVPAAPAAAVPGTVRNTGPIGDAAAGAAAGSMADAGVDSSNEFPACSKRKARSGALVEDCAAPDGSGAMAKAAPSAPPVSVPGTVRNTAPIAVDSGAGAAMAADPMPAGSAENFPPSNRQRAPRGALTDDNSGAADSGALQDSPPPPPIPAPPTQVGRSKDRPMDIPAPTRPQSNGPASAAPVAPAAAVPGTVRNTAPTAADGGATGNVQMPAAKAAPIPAPEYEKISLSADVLFKFDRYREKDMLPAGRAKLDDVADKINNYIVDTIDHIDLTGHTDRLGSDAYNQRLSERRAKTVKNYLVKKGVDGSKITDKGRGEHEPVVQCKGNKATKKLIRCLQPNRRVDVEIHGVKQK
jgi:outer membrane protein OmpA-like peptidoglycan-associated protein